MINFNIEFLCNCPKCLPKINSASKNYDEAMGFYICGCNHIIGFDRLDIENPKPFGKGCPKCQKWEFFTGNHDLIHGAL